MSDFDLEGKGVVFSQGFTGSEKYLFFGEYAAIYIDHVASSIELQTRKGCWVEREANFREHVSSSPVTFLWGVSLKFHKC